jgi:hypothetical protein
MMELNSRHSGKIRFLAPFLFLGGFCLFSNSSGLPHIPKNPAAEPKLASRIVPAFCQYRLPDADMLKIANLPLPVRYPSEPPPIHPFHPLLSLMPYLVALDNRALQGKIVKEDDGPAISALLDWQERSGQLVRRDGMTVLEYPVPTEQIPAPFISSMSQAGLAYLASVCYALTGEKKYLAHANEALRNWKKAASGFKVLALNTNEFAYVHLTRRPMSPNDEVSTRLEITYMDSLKDETLQIGFWDRVKTQLTKIGEITLTGTGAKKTVVFDIDRGLIH